MISKKHLSRFQIKWKGHEGDVLVYPQFWSGSTIRFYFEERCFGRNGHIDMAADTGNLKVHLQPGKITINPEEYRSFLATIFRTFVNFYRYGWSPEPNEIPKYHDVQYHLDNGYLVPDDLQKKVSGFQADVVKRISTPGKVLVAGCSGGALVQSLRELGMEAFGFDLIEDIQKHALPAARDYLRRGSLTEIPFEANDGFDTLVAVDVLEHVPERDVAKMVREWLRLDVKKLVLLINHNQWDFCGHITLRPIEWWAKQWDSHFNLIRTYQLPQETFFKNDDDENHIWRYWERY